MQNVNIRHALFWLTWWLVQGFLMGGGKELQFYLPKQMAMVSLQMVVVYINWFFLYPYLFKHRRFIIYGILSIVLIYGIFIVSFTWIKLVLGQMQLLISSIPRPDFPGIHFDYRFWQWFSGSVPYSLALVVSLVVKIYWDNQVSRRENEELESEKQALEVTYLRNQINPHFLFNSLNNIHSLILQDKSSASEYTLALSDVMRHMLYEVKHDTIPLQKEITCVENLFNLIAIRNRGTQSSICTVDVENKDLAMAPLLICSIVENGIKHSGIEYLESAELELDITESDRRLRISMVNSIKPNESGKDDGQCGIGLTNLRKRLSLVYPEQYQFTFDIIDEKAITVLDLDLS